MKSMTKRLLAALLAVAALFALAGCSKSDKADAAPKDYTKILHDARPGLYTEPGRGPPGLLPTNKADILEVMKEVHQPDIVNVVVHFISPFSNGGRYEAYGRRTAPANSLKNTFRWLALFDTTSRALGGSRRTVLAHITGISPLRGSLRAAPIA